MFKNKEELVKRHNDCLNNTHRCIRTYIRCFPDVVCIMISEYAQDLIHYALTQNFDRHWKPETDKRVKCDLCCETSNILFSTKCNHRNCRSKNKICEFGHLEICFDHEQDDLVYYYHSLLLYSPQPEVDVIVTTIDSDRTYTPVDSKTKEVLMKWAEEMIQ